MEAISLSLKVCFLADKILLALGEILKEKKINENESKILKEASDFFDQVLLGKELVRTLKVDTQFVEASSLYGVALDSVLSLKSENKIKGHTEKILTDYQKTLNRILDKTTNNQVYPEQSLVLLRQFFITLRTIGLDRIERPIEEVVIMGG